MVQILLTFPYDSEESEQFKVAVEDALRNSGLRAAEVTVEVVEDEATI